MPSSSCCKFVLDFDVKDESAPLSYQLKQYSREHTNIDGIGNCKTETLVHILQNLVFQRCSVIVNEDGGDKRSCICSTLNEYGLDASLGPSIVEIKVPDKDENQKAHKTSQTNVIINFTFSMPLCHPFEYLKKIGKFTLNGWTNFVISFVEENEYSLLKDFNTLPFIPINLLPTDFGILRDGKKMKGYADQQTQQLIFREETKGTAGNSANKHQNQRTTGHMSSNSAGSVRSKQDAKKNICKGNAFDLLQLEDEGDNVEGEGENANKEEDAFKPSQIDTKEEEIAFPIAPSEIVENGPVIIQDRREELLFNEETINTNCATLDKIEEVSLNVENMKNLLFHPHPFWFMIKKRELDGIFDRDDVGLQLLQNQHLMFPGISRNAINFDLLKSKMF